MKILSPTSVAKPGPGYSQGIAANGTIYVAGQVSVGADGTIEGKGNIARQTRQTLENVRRVLAEGGLGLSDVVSTTVYLKDLADYRVFAQTWCEVFGDQRVHRLPLRPPAVSRP